MGSGETSTKEPSPLVDGSVNANPPVSTDGSTDADPTSTGTVSGDARLHSMSATPAAASQSNLDVEATHRSTFGDTSATSRPDGFPLYHPYNIRNPCSYR